MTRTAELDAALARAAAAATPGDVLSALVEAWRACPDARLADLIDIVGERARTTHDDGGSLDDRHARWLAIAGKDDPADLPWLVARLVAPRGDLMRERIAALAARPRDPRIAMALVELCKAKPMSSRPHRAVWTRIFRLLHRGLDPRLGPAIAALLEARALTEFDTYLHSKLRALLGQLGTAAELPVAARPAVAALEAKLEISVLRAAERTSDDFLHEIWAAPADDGPREVYADWLIQRGDPRGELITLQLARARGTADPSGLRRERALLAEHARAWMGALEPVVSRTVFEFERGFLARCEIQWRKLAALPALMTHPAWATVRGYRLSTDGDHACDRWLDHMIALGARRL